MDALQLLTDDHARVRDLLSQLEETSERAPKRREKLFGQIKRELSVHETIEEEIFYPALKEHPKAREIVLEGYEEHNVVDHVMGELERLPFDDETWVPKAKVMKENVEHHIEEEEGEMFRAARAVFDRDELQSLGEQMAARKESAMVELGVPG